VIDPVAVVIQSSGLVRVVNDYLDRHPVLTAGQRAHLKKLSDYIATALDGQAGP